uniref:t-SNARE coiled-coil homology domain-containing protein n=2 Tax=Caenorhabditis tropicalis TaxID=1561998 RepID=A0A1I7UG60_9PELO
MAPPKRKLTFDTFNDTTINFEENPDFPKEWKIDGVNIDERIQKLRDELREKGASIQPNAVVDPKSKFRTVKHSTRMMSNDIDALHNRREHVENTVEELKAQLTRLDSSVGILKSQQLAVKSVLELREDEYMAEDADDSNIPDEYNKFSKISKLCEVALKSYAEIKKQNEEMQKNLFADRNRQRKEHEATMNSMDPNERERVVELDKLLKDFSLDQLKELRDRMREKRK